MRVYVLSEVWQMDSGDFGNDIRVFETIEDATKVFRTKMKDAKKDFKDLETEQDHYTKGDMSWSIWEKDEYAYNHIDLVIYERDVE